MGKMSCDIIQDLIPSYLDGVCSTATRGCVEEHIKNCAECREIVALGQNNALTGNKTEYKILDGFRKTKKKMQYLYIGNFVLTIFIFFGMQEFLLRTNALSLSFFALFSVSMCANLIIYAIIRAENCPKRTDYRISILSVALILCPALLFYYFTKTLTATSTILFGLETRQCGPFFNGLFFLVFIIQLACFLYFLFCAGRRDKNCILLSCPALTGMFLMMAYRALLGRLDTPEGFFSIFFQINAVGIVIAVLGVIGGVLLMKKL